MEGRTTAYPPDFLILGAQKCGTTSLASALRTHPQVFLPSAKEAQHFGTVDVDQVGDETYRRFFSEWSGEPVVGEASPSYLFLPRAAAQITRALPEVKGIVLLRNPVDRAYSGYWHRVRAGRVRGSFVQEIDDELARGSSPRGSFRNILERGEYASQLRRFFDHGFDRGRMLILVFEEMVADRSSALGEIEDFLELDRFLDAIPRENSMRRNALPRRIRAALDPHYRSGWARLVHRLTDRPFTPPPMEPEVRARLVEYFRPHNARLAELLGRDLPDWDR
ncbi:MAG: sulfotransferase family protein [Acidimicrobiia bacterium]